MSVIIEVTSQEVQNRAGTSQRTGKQYSINEQTAYVHRQGQPYPEKIKVTLGDQQQPYAVGNYDLHPDSYYVDKFGSLAVRPFLVPRPAEVKTDQQRKAS